MNHPDILKFSAATSRFYEMCHCAPWGDYGFALIHGLCAPESLDGKYRLYRSGPRSIPIAKPETGVLVVDDEVREVLSRELGIAKFEPVLLDRVIRAKWEEWNPDARPGLMPPSKEPEGYYLEFDHEPALLDEMGPLWRPQIDVGATAVLAQENEIFAHMFREVNDSEWRINRSTWSGAHLFLSDGGIGPFVTEFGREVLSKYSGAWIRYLPTRQS